MRGLHLTSLTLACLLLLCAASVARAQDSEPRWEVGGQFSAFNVENGTATVTTLVICIRAPCPPITTTTEGRATEPGFGARVGYGLNRYVTVEAEGNFFPRERQLTDEHFTGGRKIQGLFGVKVGRRYENFGVFAKARPGFVHFEAGDLRQTGGCIAIFPPPLACFEGSGRTDFALDLGGVVELYPSARTLLRIDAGDTVLRTRAHNIPVGFVVTGVPAGTTHNFQGSVGFGFRF